MSPKACSTVWAVSCSRARWPLAAPHERPQLAGPPSTSHRISGHERRPDGGRLPPEAQAGQDPQGGYQPRELRDHGAEGSHPQTQAHDTKVRDTDTQARGSKSHIGASDTRSEAPDAHAEGDHGQTEGGDLKT